MSCIVKSSINFITVTFDGNGGTSTVSSLKLVLGSKIGSLPTASKTNYDFLGWFTEAGGGTQITSETVVKADIIFYAHYKIKTLTVTFSGNGIGGSPSFTTRTYNYGSTFDVLPTISDSEYNFVAWSLNGTNVIHAGDTVTQYGNVTALASWQIKPIAITVYANGGKFADGTTTSKVFHRNVGEQYGSFGLSKDNAIVSFYTDDASTTVVDHRSWSDTVVVSNKVLWAVYRTKLKLKFKGDFSSVLSKVEIRSGGRLRARYTTITADTLLECYVGGGIVLYGKQSPKAWHYKFNSVPAVKLDPGLGLVFNLTTDPSDISVAYLSIKDNISTDNAYRVFFRNDGSDDKYNSSGWVLGTSSANISLVTTDSTEPVFPPE